MPLRNIRELMMDPDPPAVLGPLGRFIRAYEAHAMALEQSQKEANLGRNKSFHKMLTEVQERHNQPHLGLQRMKSEQKRAREQFALDNDEVRLRSALDAADVQYKRDHSNEIDERKQAIDAWQKNYGAASTAEREAFDRACEGLFAAFEVALEDAIIAANVSAMTVCPEYQNGVTIAETLMPVVVQSD